MKASCRFLCTAIVAFVSLFGVGASSAWSQSAATIKLVVPYPPGGGIDALARIIAEQVGRAQGPAMVIENRPGAGTEIGTEVVVRSMADGNTLLVNNAALLLLPHLRKVDYDPFADLAPICNLASTPNILVVNSNSPFKNLDDFLRAARGKAGGLTYGSAPGGLANVAFEMLAHRAGIRLTFVPFGGTTPAINALLGEHIDAAMADYPAAAGQLKGGKLRALVVTSRKRMEALPNVPTAEELGYRDYEVEVWYGMFAPAKTPPEAISRLSDWLSSAIRAPQVRAKLAAQEITPVAACGADFATYLRKQSDDYGRAIRESNMRAE
ncbi:MAG TPA: tripartite tricarboxylate transporter substrate binding protein [Xanthobacteraceae bacterium]